MNIKTYSEADAKELGNVNIYVFDSKGKKILALQSDIEGDSVIPDTYLSDKNGRIEFTHAEHEKLSVQIGKFNGNAFLKSKDITLGNVVVYAKKKIEKPKIVLKNPFEKPIVAPPQPTPPTSDKKFPVWVAIAGAGIAIGLSAYFIFKN